MGLQLRLTLTATKLAWKFALSNENIVRNYALRGVTVQPPRRWRITATTVNLVVHLKSAPNSAVVYTYLFIYPSYIVCFSLSLSLCDSFWFAICNGGCMLFSCGMQICRKWEAARMSAQTSIAMSRLSSNSLSYHHCFMWRWPKLICLIFILIQ